ncbi:MAG: hypothetical protein AB7L28_22160, partial [Kofleriaceae bacterium]
MAAAVPAQRHSPHATSDGLSRSISRRQEGNHHPTNTWDQRPRHCIERNRRDRRVLPLAELTRRARLLAMIREDYIMRLIRQFAEA